MSGDTAAGAVLPATKPAARLDEGRWTPYLFIGPLALYLLLFQFYLNDVEEGGETEFLYQGRKVEARKGRLIIAPAGFTHTHKGHVPASGDKYIATSWILFRRAEELFAG